MIAISHADGPVFMPSLGIYLEPDVPTEVSDANAKDLASHPFISVSSSATSKARTPKPPVVSPIQPAPETATTTQEALNG